MSESRKEGYGRNNWRGRGRGRGGRGRGRGGNWSRGEEITVAAVDTTPTEQSEAEVEVLRRRRERFARDAQKEAESGTQYGLISRGDDTRLKDDESARLSFFEETRRRVEKYNTKLGADQPCDADRERDSILMAFRKLRECVVAVDGSLSHASTQDKRFFRDVYLESIRFGVNCGSYESYMPALQWVLPVAADGRWEFSPADHEWLVLQLVEQLAVMEGRYEESLLLLNRLLCFRPVDLNSLVGGSPVETLYLSVVALINEDYAHVTTAGLNGRGAARVAQLALQQRNVSYRGPERVAGETKRP